MKEKKGIMTTLMLAAVCFLILAACGGDDKREPSSLNPVETTEQATGIDDSHDTVTDRPAYSRKR